MLLSCLRRDEWTALGPVMEVMGFDFYAAEANMAGATAQLNARISQPGVWNAVAFWFELQLDEEIRLDTSPYCDKVRRSKPIVAGTSLSGSPGLLAQRQPANADRRCSCSSKGISVASSFSTML